MNRANIEQLNTWKCEGKTRKFRVNEEERGKKQETDDWRNEHTVVTPLIMFSMWLHTVRTQARSLRLPNQASMRILFADTFSSST